MSIEVWIAFAIVSAVVLAIPGPSALMLVSYAVGHGRGKALATAAGVVFGDFVAMTISILGLGALLALSLDIYAALRLVGGVYLVYLAIRFWRAPIGGGPLADNDNLPQQKPLRVLGHAFSVTAVRPRNLAFFFAFVPQFIDPSRPYAPQVLVVEATFLSIATVSALGYVLAAHRANLFIRKNWVRRSAKRHGRTMLIASRSVTAGYRKIAA